MASQSQRRLLPFQNTFYLRRLLDGVESGVNQTFGIHETPPKP